MSTILVECYMIVGVTFKRHPLGDRPTVRLTINKPALEAHEVAVKVDLKLPASLFKKPQLTATIVVPDGDVQPVITTKVVDDIAELFHERAGIHLSISAPPLEPAPPAP